MNLVSGIIDWRLCSGGFIIVSIRAANCKLDMKVAVVVDSNYYINTTTIIMDMR
jgi:hypothetical protein